MNRSVKGTCRSADKQRDLKELGYEAFLFDTDHLTLGLGSAFLQTTSKSLQQRNNLASVSSGSKPFAGIMVVD